MKRGQWWTLPRLRGIPTSWRPPHYSPSSVLSATTAWSKRTQRILEYFECGQTTDPVGITWWGLLICEKRRYSSYNLWYSTAMTSRVTDRWSFEWKRTRCTMHLWRQAASATQHFFLLFITTATTIVISIIIIYDIMLTRRTMYYYYIQLIVHHNIYTCWPHARALRHTYNR